MADKDKKPKRKRGTASVELLTPTIKAAARRDIAAGLDHDQVRWLVDYYYSVQDFRIQADGQSRAVEQNADEGATNLAASLGDDMFAVEESIKKALDAWTDTQAAGRWAKSIVGIGPCLSAGLLAHIDIHKAPTVGHIWRFAGYDDPANYEWKKGTPRPWNAKLKVLFWKIGTSFAMQSHRDTDIYGKVYRERKELEVSRNDSGLFAEQAARALEERNIRDKDLKATYEAGRLPAGRLDARARRYAVKLFVAHLHHVMYECEFGTAPPKPYVIEHLGHAHFIKPPNWPMA